MKVVTNRYVIEEAIKGTSKFSNKQIQKLDDNDSSLHYYFLGKKGFYISMSKDINLKLLAVQKVCVKPHLFMPPLIFRQLYLYFINCI